MKKPDFDEEAETFTQRHLLRPDEAAALAATFERM